MPTLSFEQPTGETLQVDAPLGTTVMRTAVDHGVPGILGECGGHLACGTCHVYVSNEMLRLLPAATQMEEEMLGFAAAETSAHSRLGCQLVVTEGFDGAKFRVPTRQI